MSLLAARRLAKRYGSRTVVKDVSISVESGEVIDHPFTSVMEVRGGLVTRWHDYSHLGNLLDQAPQWWLDHIAAGWR